MCIRDRGRDFLFGVMIMTLFLPQVVLNVPQYMMYNLSLIHIYPFATSLCYSFTDMNFFDGITKYGLMNYIYVFTNKKTLTSFIITFRYALITVPLKLIVAFFIAYILNFKIKCVNLFRTIYYIPSILGLSLIHI